MSSKTKLIKKFITNPASLKYIQIENILIGLGFEKICAKGSHKKFKHPKHEKDLIIPVHNNECKDFYKQLAAKVIKQNKIINNFS